MTLCMAAVCYDYDAQTHRIVFAWDKRTENEWAGGDVAFKFAWAMKNWPALVAGESSKSRELLATLRATFTNGPEDLTRVNIFDKFNEVSCAHKEKLSRRYVRQMLAVDFERFLVQGEREFPSDVRARIFHEMGQLEFGGSLLVFGFTKRTNLLGAEVIEPHIVEIDRYGEVTIHPNFAAIGTGTMIAGATLYQRGQQAFTSVERTVYHMYEAARLASKSAPSVGAVEEFLVLDPPAGDYELTKLWRVGAGCLYRMGAVFGEVGPRPLTEIAELEEGDLQYMNPLGSEGPPEDEEDATPPLESDSDSPSNPETSEGQP
jgi:hypothetical protein